MRTISLIVFLLVAQFVFGQEHSRRLLEEGKEWYESVCGVRGNDLMRNVYGIGGDTVVNGKEYKKLICQVYAKSPDTGIHTNRRTQYAGALAEDGGKVWLIAPGQTEEELLYDFNLEPGTKITRDAHDGEGRRLALYVDRIAEEKILGTQRRCLYLHYESENGDEPESVKWVEGIGSVTGSLLGEAPFLDSSNSSQVVACSIDGRRVYDMDGERMLKDGKHWKMTYTEGDDELHTEELRINGDTLTLGLMAWKMERRVDGGKWEYYAAVCTLPWNCYFMQPAGEESMHEICRSDLPGADFEGGWQPLTDNTCAIGVETVWSCDISRRRYWLSPLYTVTERVEYWIEGVGFIAGPFAVVDWDSDTRKHLALECYEDGRLVYEWHDKNFHDGISTPAADKDSYTEIYDIQGRKLRGMLKHGLYIEGGAKVIVK